MGQVIDFQKFKNSKHPKTESSKDIVPSQESDTFREFFSIFTDGLSICPLCDAPVTIQKISGGEDTYTYKGTDVRTYYRMKAILAKLVQKFSALGMVSEIEECFGTGFSDFLKELQEGK